MIEFEKNPFLYGLRGRIGDFVVYQYRNRRCIRQVPRHTTAPSTPGQVAQQERIAALAIFYQAMKEVGIYRHWQEAAKGMVQTGYNLLVKANLPAFDGNGRICDFPRLLLTTGRLRLPGDLRVSPSEAGTVAVEWSHHPFPRTAPDDRLHALLLKDGESFDLLPADTGGSRRDECRALIRLPEEGKDFPHLYLFFCSETSGECTNSLYFNLLNTMYHGNL